jgi:hypothetical protein
MRLQTCLRVVVLAVILPWALPATGDEPVLKTPQTAPAGVDADDPLLRALQELRRDVERLREEIRGPASSMRPPAAMPAAASTAGSRAVDLDSLSSGRMGVPNPSRQVAARSGSGLASEATPFRPPPPREPYALWSFQPLKSPPLPAVRAEGWVRSDLDRFILARLEAAGLAPNPDADRYTLVRRLAFDLTGLPPAPSEIKALVEDPASDDEALARMADYYLASPRFGERWGRHWLDVARYADSVGRTWNAPFTYAWRYRDWVIDAFNQDLPYDRFVTLQLAGDLLPARSVEEQRANLIATGFLALGSLPLNGGRLEGFKMDRVDDQIDVTTRAFLGLTVSCARCHDHKYDPVSMRDYYALAGIFYSTDTWPGQGHQGDMGRGGYVDAERLVALPSLDPAAAERRRREPAVHSMSDWREAWQQVRDAARYTYDPDLAMGVLEGDVQDCDLRIKGDPYDRDIAPPRGEIRIAGLPEMPAIPPHASGRLELARWITSPDHPLTARVMANRVWRHLFGRGLVATVDNFGVNGQEPSHPELLDHLATRLIDEGWSAKRLIRTIVLSRTWRLSSAGQPAGKELDPRNELYGRRDLRRLELEALRDSLLAAAGRLELPRPEGIPVAGTGGKGRTSIVRSLLPIDSPHRTVYLPVLRDHLPELYGTFDFPDPCQISGQREVTTVAPQALFFMNSDFVVDCASSAADRLLGEPAASEADRVRLAYHRLLSRPPASAEIDDALDLLDELRPPASERDPQLYRWTTLVQALLASGEFRYVP